jgi:hypothetical protein
MRRLPAIVAVLLAAAVSAASAGSAPQLPGHLLLINTPGLRVYSPVIGVR